MEKKRLMEHWNSSLAGMKQRDEAYVVTQELLRYGLKADPEDTSDLSRRDSRRGSSVCPVGFGTVGRCVRQNKFPALKHITNVKKHISLLLFSLS